MTQIPTRMKAFVLEKGEGKPGKVYHPAGVQEIDVPKLKAGEVLVKISAAAYNHSPAIVFSSVSGADGAGTVVAPSSAKLYNKQVLISPSVGWESDIDGPDVPSQEFGIYGNQRQTGGKGTFAEYMAIEEDKVVECPAHFSKAEAAAFPLAGVTAWRAVFTKAKVQSGQNVLITGIGGGVAIQALQFCVAAGAKVWVTSGSAEKIERAKKMGAEGGVSYKDDKWPAELTKMLPKDRPYLDVVVDSGGGRIAIQVARPLKIGGIISCYGSTTGEEMPVNMTNVLRNQVFAGSTMGSFTEFKDAVKFCEKHEIHPVVHTVYRGLEQAEEGYKTMKEGSQFGKLVIDVSGSASKL